MTEEKPKKTAVEDEGNNSKNGGGGAAQDSRNDNNDESDKNEQSKQLDATAAPWTASSAAAGAATAPQPPQQQMTPAKMKRPGFTPLNGRWTLWFDNPRLAPAGSDWKENLKKCGTFSTVEDFWRIFNNLKPATQLQLNSNYSVFRHGVEPSWEDPSNCEGGKFVLTIPKKESKTGKCDEYWLFTILAVIGETLDHTG